MVILTRVQQGFSVPLQKLAREREISKATYLLAMVSPSPICSLLSSSSVGCLFLFPSSVSHSIIESRNNSDRRGRETERKQARLNFQVMAGYSTPSNEVSDAIGVNEVNVSCLPISPNQTQSGVKLETHPFSFLPSRTSFYLLLF